MERLIVLDTETTGKSTNNGDRIIEIACVEILDRKMTKTLYQQYIKPNKSVGESYHIHNISDEFLEDKPQFASIADELLEIIDGQTLVIHNALFDIEFLDYEFLLLNKNIKINNICKVIDTLALSKKLNPAGRHSLDAICRRYNIDISQRVKHGALIDAKILAEAYLALTGGQFSIFSNDNKENVTSASQKNITPYATPIIYATAEDIALDNSYF